MKLDRPDVLFAVIKHYGSVSKTAAALGRSISRVSRWTGIPGELVEKVAAETGIAPAKLRPDLYGKDSQ